MYHRLANLVSVNVAMDEMWCFLYHIICLSDFGVVLFLSMMSNMFGHRNNRKQHAAFAPYVGGSGPVQGDSVKIYCEVTLGPCDPEEVLFRQSADVGRGYQCIKPASNGKHHESTKEETEVVHSKWNKMDNHKWKIRPIDRFQRYIQSRFSRNMASMNYPKIWLCCLCIISLLFSATATVTGHSWSTYDTADNSCPLGNCSCCIRESDSLPDKNITDTQYDPNKNKDWIKACESCKSPGGLRKWKNWCCLCCCQEITC